MTWVVRLELGGWYANRPVLCRPPGFDAVTRRKKRDVRSFFSFYLAVHWLAHSSSVSSSSSTSSGGGVVVFSSAAVLLPSWSTSWWGLFHASRMQRTHSRQRNAKEARVQASISPAMVLGAY